MAKSPDAPKEIGRGGGRLAYLGCRMKIPLYWSKATAEGPGPQGRPASISCWRSSDASHEDAQQSALAAAARALQRFAARQRIGRYPYGVGPLREEVLQRFENSQGELYAAVTRNGYGALVLNAAKALFFDIDFPPASPWEGLKSAFARLFGKASPLPGVRQEEEAKDRLEAYLRAHRGWGIRLYRTRAGLRGLVTHDLFDPVSDATLGMLKAIGADPLYVRLCKAQECFRARLTPKPWRCGHFVNRTAWPREGGEQQAIFDLWLAQYMAKQNRYATCRYLGTLGVETVHPEIETIVEVHDKITRCREPLDLA
jgi:hypothetical protein